MSCSTVLPTWSRRHESTGTANTGSSPRINSCGPPSQRSRSATPPLPLSLRESSDLRVQKMAAPTTPPASPGPSSSPASASSFHSSSRTAAAPSASSPSSPTGRPSGRSSRRSANRSSRPRLRPPAGRRSPGPISSRRTTIVTSSKQPPTRSPQSTSTRSDSGGKPPPMSRLGAGIKDALRRGRQNPVLRPLHRDFGGHANTPTRRVATTPDASARQRPAIGCGSAVGRSILPLFRDLSVFAAVGNEEHENTLC